MATKCSRDDDEHELDKRFDLLPLDIASLPSARFLSLTESRRYFEHQSSFFVPAPVVDVAVAVPVELAADPAAAPSPFDAVPFARRGN